MNTRLEIHVNGNTYNTVYPRIGQMIDIKMREIELSKGNLSQIINSDLLDDINIMISIKAIAHIEVLFPQLIADLKVKSILDLGYQDFIEIQKVFIEKVLPWMLEWKNNINENFAA